MMTTTNYVTRFRHYLWQPIDIAFLVFFRIAFGAIMLWEVGRYFQYDWIAGHWINPQFHFTYYGFSWVRPWSGTGMYLHFAILGVLAFCIMLGIKYRVSALLFWLGFSYIFLLEQSQYLNHFYLISLLSFLLIFLPAGDAFSVDTYFQPESRRDYVPRWTQWLLRFQIGLVYVYGGIAKLNHDWLRGDPMRIWLADRTDFPLIGELFVEEWMVYLFSYGGLLLDLWVVPFLLWKRTRKLAFAAVVGFHLMNSQLFSIGIFPFMMIAATTLFFESDWARRLWGWRKTAAKTIRSTKQTRVHQFSTAILALFVLVQIAMPLRHFFYPSNVHWSEEGHNFAWHMKLRDKRGRAQFFVYTQDEMVVIDLDDYLTKRQIRKMTTRPDMLLQFAHYLAAEWRAMGYADVAVRATVLVSLNGRDRRLLIDPTVNLAEEVRSLRPKSFITD